MCAKTFEVGVWVLQQKKNFALRNREKHVGSWKDFEMPFPCSL